MAYRIGLPFEGSKREASCAVTIHKVVPKRKKKKKTHEKRVNLCGDRVTCT